MAMKTASKASFRLLSEHVLDLVIEGDLHPHGLDATDLGHQVGARQPIGGNAEMQHAARQGAGVANLNRVAPTG